MGTLRSARSALAHVRRRFGWWTAARWLGCLSRYRLRVGRWPAVGFREHWYATRAIAGRRWGGAFAPGPWAERFARQFASLHGARHGLCVASGGAALTVAYQALGLVPGDEIIVPAITFSGTASSALVLGIRPVFADVEERTWCVDPEAVRRCLTPRTRAIVAVHLGSQVADLDRLREIADEHRLYLIEDCAHAHGQRWGERGVGTVGDVGCFSFESSKMLTSGEGGLILTDDEQLADRCHAYLDCGRPKRDGDPPHGFLGANLRLSELQAALLAAQVPRLGRQVARRRRSVRFFSERLRQIPCLRVLTPHEKAGEIAGYFYAFRYLREENHGVSRDSFVRELNEQGVPVSGAWCPVVYRAPEFGWRDPRSAAAYADTRCPVAERVVDHEFLSIPHTWFLAGPAVVGGIADAIGRTVRG